MNKLAVLFIFVIFFLFNCATTQIGTRKDPLTDEIIERKVEMKVISVPTISLAPGEEITAYTKIEPNFVIKIQKYLKKRHNYIEIIIYEKRVNPFVAYCCLFSGIGFLFPGAGVLLNPSEFEKQEKKFEDDKSYTSSPLSNKPANVEIKESTCSLALFSDSLGETRIPADSIIKLCPEKDEISFIVRFVEEPTVQKELTIASFFIVSFRKREELKRQEEIKLAILEKEREKIEKEIIKIINKAWTNKNKVCDRVSVYYRADSTVDVYYDMSLQQKKGIIDIVINYNYGVRGAIDWFKRDVWMQFGTLAPALFKKSYVKSLAITSTVQFETNYGQIYPLRAVRIEMNRATAKKVDWVADYMQKEWKIADSCVVDKTFEGFLITFLNDLYWEGWR